MDRPNRKDNVMKSIAKKNIGIYILKVLYCYTSREFPATQTAIVNYLNDLDVPCARKTVGRNINYLIESGVPIKRINGKSGGYYYDTENDKFLIRKIDNFKGDRK